MPLKPEQDLVSSAGLHQTHSASASNQQALAPGRRGLSFALRLDHAILNLQPSFFSINMGTGITSILLHQFPYNAGWVQRLSIVIFVLNILIFSILALGSIIRYVRWKGVFTALGRHNVASMYWGCMSMGFTTIVNMVALVCVPAWGYHWAQLAVGLWVINVTVAILCNLGGVFMLFTRQEHTPNTVSAIWLLPVVSSIVVAASGAVVAESLLPFDPHLARSVIIVAYIVWGTGIPLACMFMTFWVYRTAIGGIPAPAALPSIFLPLGPCGQGSYGIMVLGRIVRDLAYTYNIGLASSLPLESTYHIADAIYGVGLVLGLILWGLGFCWYILAMSITIDHAIRNTVYLSPDSFSIGWLAYTFPIGVWATATGVLANDLNSSALRVITAFLSVQVVLQWFYCGAMIAAKLWRGTLFTAPELDKWDGRPPKRWGDVEKAG